MKRPMKRKWVAALACMALLTVPMYGAAEKKKQEKSAKAAPGKTVDLNTASQKDLESLPGVGAATAKKIIAGRPYGSAKDLAKAGVSAKTIAEITPMVSASGGSAMNAPAAKPVSPKSAAATPSAPAAPSVTKQTGTNAAKAGVKPAVPPPGPGMVWVNLDTKVYHKEGQRWFGNTKSGKYMTEADAMRAGYRASKE